MELDSGRSGLMAWAATDPNGLLDHILDFPPDEREPLVRVARAAPNYDPWADSLLARELDYTAPALQAAA